MRNFLSALARALRGTVALPFWLADNTWHAFRTAFGPRVPEETAYAVEDAANVITEPSMPKFDEMRAIIDALRVIVTNSRLPNLDDALPMQLKGIDFRWSEWLSRIEAPEAQRALNAEKSRPGALNSHRSGEMKMIGIPRVKTEKEYKTDNEENLAAAREEFIEMARNMTPEQEAALLEPFNQMVLGNFAPKC